MAQFRDLIITGPSRFLGNVFLSGSLEIGSSLSVLGDIEGQGDLSISGTGEFLDGVSIYTPSSGSVALADFIENDSGQGIINLGYGSGSFIDVQGEQFNVNASNIGLDIGEGTSIAMSAGNLNLSGTSTTITGATTITGNTTITGDATVTGDTIGLTATSNINVNGPTNITGATNINGNVNVTNASTLTVAGLITGNNGLSISGADSTFNTNVSISSSKNLTVGGILTVTGASRLNGGIVFDTASDSITWGSNAGIKAGTTELILAPGSTIAAANGLSLTSSDIKWKGYSLLTTNNYGTTLNSKYIQKNTTDKTSGKVNFNGGIGFNDNKGTIAWDATEGAIVVSFA